MIVGAPRVIAAVPARLGRGRRAGTRALVRRVADELVVVVVALEDAAAAAVHEKEKMWSASLELWRKEENLKVLTRRFRGRGRSPSWRKDGRLIDEHV